MRGSRRQRDGTGGGDGKGWAVVGMVALAVAVLVGLAAVAFFNDEPLEPAPDLAWEPTDWPEEANGAALLMGLAEQREFISEEDAGWMSGFLSGWDQWARPWDGARASRILDGARAHLAALDGLRESAVIAAPAGAREDEAAWIQYLVATGRQIELLSDLGFLCAWQALETGDHEGARTAVQRVITLNHRALDGSESMPEFFRRAGQVARLAGWVGRMIDAGLVPDADLQEAQAALGEPAVFDRAFERSLKGGHARVRTTISRYRPFDPEELDSYWGLLPRLRPNRTINFYASLTRDRLAGVGLPFSELEALASTVVALTSLEQLLATNRRGAGVVAEVEKQLGQESLMFSMVRTRLVLAVTQTALRRHQLDHGGLPATLDDLVPDYLEAVPTDWGDGEAVRYDPSRRVIWGVGKNLADDGGDPGVRDDICVALGWLEKAEAHPE